MEKLPSLFGIIIRLLIVISIALYIFFKFSFEIFDIHFDKRELRYNILFEHATGVEKNTQLELSGFKIGHVIDIKHVRIGNQTKARIEVVINKKYQDIITDKASFFIARRKFIGLTFVEILPVLDGKILKNGDTINGISPPRYNLLFTKSKELLSYLNKFLEKSHFNDLLNEYNSLIKETRSLNKLVNKKIPDIKNSSLKLLRNIRKFKRAYDLYGSSICNNGKDIFITTNKLINNKKRIGDSLNKVDDISNKFLDIKDNSLLQVKENQKDISKIINNLKNSIESIDNLRHNVNKTISILDVGIGNIGLFLNDREIYDYTRFIFKIIKQESYKYVFPVKHDIK